MAAHAVEYKIILLGDPGVGKTTFFLRLRDGEFVDTENRPTASVGVDDMEYQHVVEGVGMKIFLNDTGGGERFRTLTSNFYRNADAAILMYSVEDRYTFENLHEWIDNASDSIFDLDNFVWALVGNKTDLPLEIEHDSIRALCEQLNTKLSFFTSAKMGDNVEQAFKKICDAVHKKKSGTVKTTGGIKIQSSSTSAPGSKKSGCC